MKSRSNNIIKLVFCYMALAAIGCRESFDPPFMAPRSGYLVVEGYINSNGPSTIKLSRSIPLDANRPTAELNAVVRVEGQNNTVYPLANKGQGFYSADLLPVNSNEKYRLYIRTTNGKEYVSDFSPVRKTPPIDNLEWKRENGVQIYINTHDPQNNTKYYRWDFDETWLFHPVYRSLIKYVKNSIGSITGVDYRTVDETEKLYNCWKTVSADKILIGTSATLTRDSIHLPLTYIPPATQKISVLYSINVKQFAISEAEYNFLSKMKKNTEQVGSLFDSQPSEISGNIHCKTDPAEIVIGFISVSDVQEKRIFIENGEVPGWRFLQDCPLTTIANKPAELNLHSTAFPVAPDEFDQNGNIVTINVSGTECVDCTTRGTNVKPSFWP